MKLYILVLISLLSALNVSAQRDFSKVEIKSIEVKEDFYLLQGSGGNILIYIDSTDVLMIDSQFAPLSNKIENRINSISNDKSIKYLLNTHYHGDHTGGNENFQALGLQIIAHENVKKRLSEEQHIKAFNRTLPAKPSSYHPDFIYSQKSQLYIGNKSVQLIHLPAAHTDGDSGIFFVEDNVIHMGDTFFKDRFPYIDLSSGGSIAGLIEAVKTVMMLVDENTHIIPGHGDLANKSDLQNYLDMLIDIKTKVETSLASGMSLEAIKSANLTEGYESYGTGFISAEQFIDTIWTDLNR